MWPFQNIWTLTVKQKHWLIKYDYKWDKKQLWLQKWYVMTTLINDYNVNYKVDYLIDITQTGWKKDRLKISTTVFLTQTTAEKIGNGWDSVILIFFSPVAYSKCTILFSKVFS